MSRIVEPLGRDVPESITRPLGKGYHNMLGFLDEHIHPLPIEGEGASDLAMRLQDLERIEYLDSFFSGLPTSPLCLIEGYAAPTNGAALMAFVKRRGVLSPRIKAIDLCDVASIYAALAIEIPDVEFRVGDAADLRGMYPDDSVDLVVQDHLLNCAPHAFQEAVLAEAGRVLKACGTAIIHFTASDGIAATDTLPYAELQMRHGILMNESAFNVLDLAGGGSNPRKVLASLMGKSISDPLGVKYSLVTAPDGNLQFFTSFQATQKMLDRAGLRLAAVVSSQGKDRSGILWTRYRTLAKKMPR